MGVIELTGKWWEFGVRVLHVTMIPQAPEVNESSFQYLVGKIIAHNKHRFPMLPEDCEVSWSISIIFQWAHAWGFGVEITFLLALQVDWVPLNK